MKKLIIALILGLILIPPVALAENPSDENVAEGEQDTEAAQAEIAAESDAAASSCDWGKITQTEECLSKEDREEFQYTVLEESITGTEGEYASEGSQVRQCQRMIQIETCTATGEAADKKQSSTKYVKDKECKPEGNKSSKTRVICEDITMLMTPMATGGAGLLNTYIGLIYRWAAGIVGIIAVLIIVINAVIIIASQGEQGQIDEAKKRIFQSLGGIAILFLSSLILYTINPDFFKL